MSTSTSHATLLAELGYLACTQAAFSDSEVLLDGLVELEPSSSAYVLRGGLEVGRRQFQSAENFYRNAVEADPDSDVAKACLAESLLLQKRFREGERLLNQVIESGREETAVAMARALDVAVRDGSFHKV